MTSWTQDQITGLKELLLAQKYSYSEIGAKIGKTKGAIAGYVDRHLRPHRPNVRLRTKSRPKIAKVRGLQAVVAQPKIVAAISVQQPVTAEPVSLKEPGTPLDGRHECSYITGHPRDGEWRYCGHQTIPKSSYCAYHHAATVEVRFRTKRVDRRTWVSEYKTAFNEKA